MPIQEIIKEQSFREANQKWIMVLIGIFTTMLIWAIQRLIVERGNKKQKLKQIEKLLHAKLNIIRDKIGEYHVFQFDAKLAQEALSKDLIKHDSNLNIVLFKYKIDYHKMDNCFDSIQKGTLEIFHEIYDLQGMIKKKREKFASEFQDKIFSLIKIDDFHYPENFGEFYGDEKRVGKELDKLEKFILETYNPRFDILYDLLSKIFGYEYESV